MTWDEFSSKVRTYQRGFMGDPKEVRPGRGAFHENPSSCICENAEAKAKADSVEKESGKIKKDVDAAVEEDQNTNDDLEWSDPEDEDDLMIQQRNNLYNETSMDYENLTEEPDMNELLSD